jgi:gluconate 2-dehydrogenase gamma chain
MMSEMMHMDRRSLLQSAFALVGASVALSACDFGSLGSKGTFTFDDKQRALVSAIADTFVPKTDTAGAVEAGVPKVFEGLLSNWAKPETKDLLLAAMDKIDAGAKAKGKGFVDMSPKERLAFLTPYDVAGLKIDEKAPKLSGLAAMFAGPAYMDPGYSKLKTLLVSLYYTSEAALTQELPYNHNPGKFVPSMPITDKTRPASGGMF